MAKNNLQMDDPTTGGRDATDPSAKFQSPDTTTADKSAAREKSDAMNRRDVFSDDRTRSFTDTRVLSPRERAQIEAERAATDKIKARIGANGRIQAPPRPATPGAPAKAGRIPGRASANSPEPVVPVPPGQFNADFVEPKTPEPTPTSSDASGEGEGADDRKK